MIANKLNNKWKSAAARRLLALAGNPASVEEAVRTVAADAIRGVAHPPLALEDLAKQLNIVGIETEDIPFSGELRPSRRGLTVVCSTHLSPTRRRFTIAHELSHAIFEKTGRNCPRTGTELERLCDMLATELLMPREAFLHHAGPDPGVHTIYELARIFGTSLMATANRCSELMRLSVFQVEDKSVLWSYGALRKGPVRLLDSDLQRLIADGAAGGSGEAVLRLTIRDRSSRWYVKYQGSKQNRTLFVLRPHGATPSALQSKTG